MADDLERVVVWKNLLIDGTEYCGPWHTAEGWLLKGTVVGVLKNRQPMLVNYEVYCHQNWLTHRVQVRADNWNRCGEPQPDRRELWPLASFWSGVA
jgi:Putative glycolipid-binding